MRDDGNAAFPVPESSQHAAWPGMSLRDYFAAAALQGMCANEDVVARMRSTGDAEHIDPQVLLATAAYGAADAMLQERAK